MQCAHLVLWYYYRANNLYLNCFTCTFSCSPSTIVYTLSTARPTTGTTDTHLCTHTTTSTCTRSCVLANTINYYNLQLYCVVYSVPTNGSSSPHLYSTLKTTYLCLHAPLLALWTSECGWHPNHAWMSDTYCCRPAESRKEFRIQNLQVNSALAGRDARPAPAPKKRPPWYAWGIQVILVMSVILWHEKTKIQKW